MRGPIEFERLFHLRVKHWKKEVDKRKTACKSTHSYLKDERFEEIFKSRLTRRKERLIGIWDKNHSAQDGFRKNNFLSALFARFEGAPENYRVSPYGNFLCLEYPKLKEEHLQVAASHPNWYAYRKTALEWEIDAIIDMCALNHVLSSLMHPQEKPMPELKDLKTALSEKTGVMNSSQLARYLGKSPATITRWLKQTDIPHKRFNGRVSFKKDEIDAWLERGAREKK